LHEHCTRVRQHLDSSGYKPVGRIGSIWLLEATIEADRTSQIFFFSFFLFLFFYFYFFFFLLSSFRSTNE